ncbi:hypothetical protein LTS18_002259 [Coniosporium uncinatum]|uniref:Uncharacterized protein n=1 Tax=Coniosporium uncinatum TaxID=93489 RepID=A0ACC3D7Q2_9PEZI|nr:hypothetical protein LTS18_002259 [Coniosporium uncinatum]
MPDSGRQDNGRPKTSGVMVGSEVYSTNDSSPKQTDGCIHAMPPIRVNIEGPESWPNYDPTATGADDSPSQPTLEPNQRDTTPPSPETTPTEHSASSPTSTPSSHNDDDDDDYIHTQRTTTVLAIRASEHRIVHSTRTAHPPHLPRHLCDPEAAEAKNRASSQTNLHASPTRTLNTAFDKYLHATAFAEEALDRPRKTFVDAVSR